MSTTFRIELKMLRTDDRNFHKTIFALNLGFCPKGPSSGKMEESASRHHQEVIDQDAPEDFCRNIVR